MSELIKVTHLKRGTFNMNTTQELSRFGNWLQGKEFKDLTGTVQIRDDEETRERLKPAMRTVYGDKEVCIPHV